MGRAPGPRALGVRSERTPRSEGLRGQVLAVEGDDRALAALGVGDLLHVELEVDRADDAVAELLVDQGLEGGAVDLEHLVEAVDRRVGRNAAGERAARRDGLEQQGRVVVQAE